MGEMGCPGEYFQVHPYKSIEDGCLLGEYFQVHPFQSIEDGLPMGEYFQVHPYKSIEDGLPIGEYFGINLLQMGCLLESIFKFILINLFRWVAYWRLFSSTPL